MTVFVTDLEKSHDLAKDFDVVISLLDKGHKSWMERGLSKIPNRKMFWFDDTVAPFHDGPTEKDVQEIIDFVFQHDLGNIEKKVLVHCFAGISRSTAVAVGILIMRGFTPAQALEQIHIQRTRMWPNCDIIKHFDVLLKLNGELILEHQRWKDKSSTTFGKLFDLATENDEWME